MNRLIKTTIALLLIFCNIGCDQITKDKVRADVDYNERIQVFGDNFIFTKIENTGAALGLGQNLSPKFKTIVLQILPLIVLGLLFFYIVRDHKVTKLRLTAFSFIIGGGIGNIYDRVLYNSVTDFMYVELGLFHTGIFNMADVSVVIGTLLILLDYGYSKIEKNRIENASL